MNTVALRKVSGNCKQFPKLSTASWNVSDGECVRWECVRWNVSEGNVPVVEDIKKRQSMSLSRRHSDLKLRLHRGNGATGQPQASKHVWHASKKHNDCTKEDFN